MAMMRGWGRGSEPFGGGWSGGTDLVAGGERERRAGKLS